MPGKFMPRLHNDRGATLIFALFAIVTLTMLAGMAIDSGQMYVARRHAQRVCDAAALAGAESLLKSYGTSATPDEARTLASQEAAALIGLKNGLQPAWQVQRLSTSSPYAFFGSEDMAAPNLRSDPDDSSRVLYDRFNGSSVAVPKENPPSAVEVQGRVRVNYSLSRVMGFRSMWVPARSIAVTGAVHSMDLSRRRFLPWGVSESAFGDLWDARFNANSNIARPNDIATFYVGGGGVNTFTPLWASDDSDYKQLLVSGRSSGSITAGDTLPGAAPSPPRQLQLSTWHALEARVNGYLTPGHSMVIDVGISPTGYDKESTPGQNDQWGGYGLLTMPQWLSPYLSGGVTPNPDWYAADSGNARNHYWEWKVEDGQRADGRAVWLPVLSAGGFEVRGFARVFLMHFYFRRFDDNVLADPWDQTSYRLTPDNLPVEEDWRLAVDVIFVDPALLLDARMVPGRAGFGVYGIALAR
ncbi:MAG: hypothetical protein IT210_05745 [Armatimonadetes bacterium]|nr:hypothetical protein [Armatimonadota bacterium]